MRALYLTGIRRLDLQDAPEPPAPRSDEVLLRVATVGICGSDLHYYRTGRIGDQVVDFPWMLGHECSAVVEQTGDEVQSLSVGDRVAVDPLVWCNECDQCLTGRVHTCRNQKFLGCPGQMQGCLCDRIVMPAQSCFRIPDALTMTQAALVEPFSIGLYSQQLGDKDLAGKSVAILGSGPIGLSVLLACRAAGADKIYATDLLDYRNDQACSMGADWAGNPETQDVVREILGEEPLGVHFAFECAGEQETTDQGLEIIRPGGAFLMVGIPEFDRMSFDFSILRRKEITVQPVRRQNHCVSPAIEMAASSAVDLDPMVTHEMSLEQSARGFEILDDYRDKVVKVMVHVSEED